MTENQVELFQRVVFQCSNDSLGVLKTEINKASNYLLSVPDAKEIEKSSRWFRENGNVDKRKLMLEKGFDSVPLKELDCVTVTNFIKAGIRSVPNGLIQDSVQALLISLLHDKKGNEI